MPLYQVVVLALIQALTEFLPISSSAHLALAPWLFGWKDPGLTFDIALHAGTLVAIAIYFFKDWVQIIAQGFGLNIGNDPELKRNRSLLWLLAAASIPVGVMGWVFGKQAESTWRNPYVIGGMLIGVGLLMWQAERLTNGKKDLGHVSGMDAITIGLSQALAVIPGTSRSAITITTGLFRNLNRETAARFSFLLSAPAIAAAAGKKAWDIYKHGGIAPDMRVPFAVGVAVSALAGAVVIAVFLRYLRRNSLMPFVYYRIIFGIIVIALAVLFRFSAE
ncbi:MAG: undecaprenyl-diphosphate phosphatase [Acidobacteriota bacterium]|nr:undecaprenyl-diphosphate phosphatase [Acidobacteriota bacterium]